MSVTTVTCPCGAELNVPLSILGKKVKCPTCKVIFSTSTPPPDPVLIPPYLPGPASNSLAKPIAIIAVIMAAIIIAVGIGWHVQSQREAEQKAQQAQREAEIARQAQREAEQKAQQAQREAEIARQAQIDAERARQAQIDAERVPQHPPQHPPPPRFQPGDPVQSRRLIDAAKGGNVQLMNAALAAGADVNAKDGGGETALHWAAYEGHYNAVLLLINNGANVNARDNAGETPLTEVGSGRLAKSFWEGFDAEDTGTAIGKGLTIGLTYTRIENLLKQHGARK